jgi:hypothetical protein
MCVGMADVLAHATGATTTSAAALNSPQAYNKPARRTASVYRPVDVGSCAVIWAKEMLTPRRSLRQAIWVSICSSAQLRGRRSLMSPSRLSATMSLYCCTAVSKSCQSLNPMTVMGTGLAVSGPSHSANASQTNDRSWGVRGSPAVR